MPLTTRHRDGRWIDSTDDAQWAEVHIARYDQLFCYECDYTMHAVDGGSVRIRHFAHNAGRPDSCSRTAPESPEHLHVKRLVALAVRELGWTASVEHRGNGWKADVLAISPHDDRRIAFEVQFSAIHASIAAERTQRHRSDGVETVWIDANDRDSLRELRRARLRYQLDRQLIDTQRLDSRGEWSSRHTPLAQFVQDVCRRAVVYDGQRWATPADHAARAQRLAEQRELEMAHIRSRRGEARQRAAMQWPLRALQTADDRRRMRAQHLQQSEQRRQRAAMQWPLRVRAAIRGREQAEMDRRNAARLAERALAEAERDRRNAAWRADRDRFVLGLADDTDAEVLARCERFAEEYRRRVTEHAAQGWGRIGDRLHAECLKRQITHA